MDGESEREKNMISEEYKQMLEKDFRNIARIKKQSEELQLFAIEKEFHSIFHIKKPTKKVALEVFFRVCEQDITLFTIYLKNFNDSLIQSLLERNKKHFQTEVKKYKQEFENTNYFEKMTIYLIKKDRDWVPGFIDSLSPLTREQQEIWNKYRLTFLV